MVTISPSACYPPLYLPRANAHLSFNIKHLSFITPLSRPSLVPHSPAESSPSQTDARCDKNRHTRTHSDAPTNTRGARCDCPHASIMLEAVDSLCVCVCVCLMTVSSLRASPTQASDNRQINALPPLPPRIKVEDEAHNDEEEQAEMRRKKKSVSDCPRRPRG